MKKTAKRLPNKGEVHSNLPKQGRSGPALTENEKIDLKELLISDGYKALQKVFDQALLAKANDLLLEAENEDEKTVFKQKMKLVGAKDIVASVFFFLNQERERVSSKED